MRWVVGKDLDLALGARGTPTPPATDIEVLGYTYEGVYRPWATPIIKINRPWERNWDHPFEDHIPYTVTVRVTYQDSHQEVFNIPLILRVILSYLRLWDLPR